MRMVAETEGLSDLRGLALSTSPANLTLRLTVSPWAYNLEGDSIYIRAAIVINL